MIDGDAVPEYGRTHLVGVLLTGVASFADFRLLLLDGRERSEAGGLTLLLLEFVDIQTSELAGKGACMVGTACQTTLVPYGKVVVAPKGTVWLIICRGWPADDLCRLIGGIF